MNEAADIVIKVKDASKAFKLPHEKTTSIKGALINFRSRKKGFERQQVLHNVTFEIRRGEFFGIVGRNGSGKSTLLKLLAGIYAADSGAIFINGKLTPFIELGVGFNPELTGRENVFLNGALLGFNRTEMEEMYDGIVEFAELERFMDQKLKNYSSGMQVRLAFSIAIRVHTDILLIDEVLAVGDANFQKKCMDVFTRLKEEGRTIVFISHDMGAVRKFCDRAIMLQDGEIVDEGRPDEIASRYETANIATEQTVESINKNIAKHRDKIISHIDLVNAKGASTKQFAVGDTATLKVTLADTSRAKNMGVAIYTADGGYVFGTNTILDNFTIGQEIAYSFKISMGKGEYRLKLGMFGETDREVYEFFDHGPSFVVHQDKEFQNWEGIVYIDHEWSNA